MLPGSNVAAVSALAALPPATEPCSPTSCRATRSAMCSGAAPSGSSWREGIAASGVTRSSTADDGAEAARDGTGKAASRAGKTLRSGSSDSELLLRRQPGPLEGREEPQGARDRPPKGAACRASHLRRRERHRWGLDSGEHRQATAATAGVTAGGAVSGLGALPPRPSASVGHSGVHRVDQRRFRLVAQPSANGRASGSTNACSTALTEMRTPPRVRRGEGDDPAAASLKAHDEPAEGNVRSPASRL